MLPGPLSSPVCPAYCQERRKMRSRSAAATAGATYQLYGSVSTRDSTCVRPIGGVFFLKQNVERKFSGGEKRVPGGTPPPPPPPPGGWPPRGPRGARPG